MLFKKRRIPWNKGKTNIYSSETIDRIKRQTSISIKEKYKNNINCKMGFQKGNKINIGRVASEEKRRKMSISEKKAYQEGRKPIVAYWKNKHHSKKTNRKNSETHREKWKNEEYAKKMFTSFRLKPNKPEKLLKKIIEKNNFQFNYVGDGKIWFRGENHSFNPDFLSKNPKHIIEVFGDYWHNRNDSKKRDSERLKTYAKYGYKTLIIWGNELELLSEQEIINKINKFIR